MWFASCGLLRSWNGQRVENRDDISGMERKKYEMKIGKKYQLVIFDLDGTILDTLEDLANSLNYALAEEGYPVRTLEEVRRFVGNGMLNLVKRVLTEPFLQESEECSV